MTTFALIHSPLVGPLTWQPVARRLEQAEHQVVIPSLTDSAAATTPFWRQHAESAANEILSAGLADACVLVGHSGTGPLLPAIAERLNTTPLAYIYVDAGLPQHKVSRLELMRIESAEWAASFEQYLLAGGRFPNWREAELESIVPDSELRRQLLQEIQPRALDFFTEPIEATEGWAKRPCGYLQFTESYAVQAGQAVQRGWPVVRLDAGHFHMLVDASQVADILLELAEKLVRQT